jgi:hypothetical protein
MNQDFLIGSVLVLLSLAVLGFVIRALRLFWTALSSRSWPTVQGRIVSMKMDVTRIQFGELYTPGLTYRYRVDGKDYEGNRIDLTSQRKFSTQSGANAVLEDYRPDGAVAVYYNPIRPTDSLLKPGVSTATWMITGLIVLLLSLFLSIQLVSV